MVGAKASAHNLTNRNSFVLFAVKCTVNARKVTISGKKGEVTKDFSHIACELKRMKQSTKKRNGTFIRIRIWFGGAKQACAVNTLKSSIGNMCIGVTEVSNTFLLSCFLPFYRWALSSPSRSIDSCVSGWLSFSRF